MLAVAGRLDAAAWNDLLSGLLPEDKQRAIRDAANRFAGPALGKNVAKDVLPGLGPDWGLCVLAPPVEMGNPKSWVPHAILALRFQRADVAHAVLKTLNSLALLGVFAYNGSHPDQIFLHSLDKMEGSYLSNDAQFPPGFQPAFAFKDGFLIFGSSPEAIGRFVLNSMPPTPPHPTLSPGGRGQGEGAADIPLFRLSLNELAQYLSAHQSALAEHIDKKNDSQPVSKEEIARKLGELAQICQLFNRLELVQQSSSGKLTLVLRIRTAFPLGK